MNPLDGLGLQRSWIYEVVVTTLSHGKPHAAAMGVWTDDFQTLRLDVYEGSRTLEAILSGGHFVANFPRDATVLAAALSPQGGLGFVPAATVASPRLRDAASVVELTLRASTRGADRIRVTGDPVHVALGAEPRLINRAEGLLLESLVIASRIGRHNTEATVAALVESRRVVHKVAPGSSCARAMDELLRDVRESA
jgi:hypothetical protein